VNATIKKGEICVDASDLIDSLDDDGRIDIISILACHDQIIESVAQQIVEGWDECGNHGYTTYSPTPSIALDKAKRYLAESASEVAKEEIARLERMATEANRKAREADDKRFEAEDKMRELHRQLSQYTERA